MGESGSEAILIPRQEGRTGEETLGIVARILACFTQLEPVLLEDFWSHGAVQVLADQRKAVELNEAMTGARMSRWL